MKSEFIFLVFGILLSINALAADNPVVAVKDTPLTLAVKNGNVRQVDLLLKNGADPNAKISDGLTALHLAAVRNEPRMVDHLLKDKANINAVSDDGWTPLILAAREGYTPMEQLLLNKDTDIKNSLIEEANTLHHPMNCMMVQIIQILSTRLQMFLFIPMELPRLHFHPHTMEITM